MATDHQNFGPGSALLPSASSITCLACRRCMGTPPAPQSHRVELATPLPRVPSTTALHLSQWYHCWSFTQLPCSGLIVALACAHSSGKLASTSCPFCECPLRPRPPPAPLTVCWTDLSTLPDPALPHTMALVPSTLVCPGNDDCHPLSHDHLLFSSLLPATPLRADPLPPGGFCPRHTWKFPGHH